MYILNRTKLCIKDNWKMDVLSVNIYHGIHKKYTFVARNRIISGLSQGILVTEAGMESGALITARFGIEQGKDVFAIPGDIFKSTSKGTNELIKNGAYLVSDPSEILEYYGFKEHRKMIELSEDEKAILQVLESSGTQDVENIAVTLSNPYQNCWFLSL